MAKCKTAHAIVYSNSSEKMETPTPTTITRQLRSDFLIPIISTRNIHSHKSKRINTESNANSLVKNPLRMSTTQYSHHQQSRCTVIESDLNESSADKKTDVTLPVTLIQCLRKCNNNHIDIIKSVKKKTKTPIWVFAKNQGNKEE